MWSLCKKTGSNQEEGKRAAGQGETAGIERAIYAVADRIDELTRAINRLAESQGIDDEDPIEDHSYMDGSPI